MFSSPLLGLPIRLVDGNGRCSGRVEVYHGQQWGTVCDDDWDMNGAAVVCRELGCGTALSAPGEAQFGQGTGEIWMDDVDCSGSESSLSQCSHTGFGEHDCDHGEDAGAVCSGPPIRLVGGNGNCSGRVEVYHGQQWGTVCDDSWDMNDAPVVCRELGCGTALSAPGGAQFGHGTGEIWMDDVGCSGNESSLSQCSHRGLGKHDCDHGQDAGAVCSGLPIRLVGGNGNCSGRVEVYHEQQWGTVCDEGWDMNDAAVVCRELGCGTALSAPGEAQFGQGTGEIWMDDVGCSGNESSLSQCSHGGLGKHNCDHGKDAGAVCSGLLIRLVGGHGNCSGRVEVYHEQQWGTVCDDAWDMNDAAVVCRQLGCGTALSAPGAAQFGQGNGTIWMDDVGCSGNESSLSQCSHRGFGGHSCGHGEDAGAVCSGLLIRLVGGNGKCSGKVEVYHGQQWGTVCDDDWDMNDAAVVCRELGCGTALSAPGGAQFGQGTGEIWIDDVDCSGSESSLSQCSHRGLGEHDCDHGGDAGAVCSASLILPIALGASEGLLLVLVPLVFFLLFWKRRHSSGRTQVAKTASNARTMNPSFAKGKASEEEDEQNYVNYRDPTENE
ncbi:deleted in malignant brain tumors 1 protein-like isoform X3 [Anguilla rostrata]|uniref:deleted in malignant brain tumors 1 protein-like isoform X3 n=1 Tax=Anguilla rostrata TaxID=7938 RepID=UPI0030D4C781